MRSEKLLCTESAVVPRLAAHKYSGKFHPSCLFSPTHFLTGYNPYILFFQVRVRHKSSNETNLLLSRLPVEPEIMDALATDTDVKQMETEAAGSVRSSLPINIERQFSYYRLVILRKP